MSSPILSWSTRHPALIDDAGTLVPLDQVRTRRPDLSSTEQPARTIQIITASISLRELLTRCLCTLDLAVSETPDLILLDLAAPNALARCRTFREQYPDLPILSLIHLAADYWQAWEAGANAVLLVPFDLLDLQATIHILLGENDD